jgi:NADH:ubiquinone oxidoreductase subunit 5 (subunit L)/multisubunit Na+/H+ antiporter MnhA subunit
MNTIVLALLVLVCLLVGTYSMAVLQQLILLGPRRVSTAFQWPIVNALLLLRQENLMPRGADRFLFRSAPFIALAVISLTALVIPLGPHLIGFDPSIGLFYFIVLLSPFVVSLMNAGWSQNSKEGLFSTFRAAAYLVSYEVPLGFAAIGPVMAAQSLSTQRLVETQAGLWYVVWQPLGLVIYLLAALFVTFRHPFDSALAGDELEGGVFAEYAGPRLLLLKIALDAIYLILMSMGVVLFFGGWQGPWLLQGWLPDAMLGPTPVSALLHSATMVAAGVFLVARLYPLLQAAGPSLQVVAWIGVLTSLLGAAAALVESDLKRTLAYSTLSQIGLMFVGLGSGSLLAGVLLLLAQALYKTTLFLAAGAVDHAVDGTAFARMGGLAKRMPLTAIAFALSAATLAGLPVTLALPPKDPVLAAAWQANTALFIAALLASWLTALYSVRAFGLVFLGTSSGPAQQAHEAQPGLLVPQLAMAALIPLGLLADAALLGYPLSRLLGERIPDVPLVTALALALAVAGVAAGLGARQVWPRFVVWPVLEPVTKLFTGELGFKTLYRVFTQLGFWIIGWLGTFDRVVFDTLTRSLVRGVLFVVRACAGIDRRALDAVLRDLGEGILTFSQRVRALQTGRIENYLLAVLVWGLGVIAIAVLAAIVR